MKRYLLPILTLMSFFGFSQKYNTNTPELYTKYREDQFYAAVTYNLLNDRPSDISNRFFFRV